MRQLVIENKAFEQLTYWAEFESKILIRIFGLIKEIQRTPFSGTGKPEPLKYELKGYWSRRINDEHRLIYKVTESSVIIASCRYHYL